MMILSFIKQLRSEIIATYALCGFANIGSIGIQIGGLSALAPKRRSDLASVAMRALIAGTFACFMTACIAGESSCLFNCLFLSYFSTQGAVPNLLYREVSVGFVNCNIDKSQYLGNLVHFFNDSP